MLSVAEALALITANTAILSAQRVPLQESLGRVLAEDINADRDSPPFTKALMDGYAVQAADVASGSGTLHVIEEVTAGRVPEHAVMPGQATRIMTGAPLPAGADAVVPVEVTECTPRVDWELGRRESGLGIVTIRSKPVRPGQSVLVQGASLRAGAVVMRQGTTLSPSHIGALAELGRAVVDVVRPARVAIVATGDELVPVEADPGPGQIRNSNQEMLAAQITRMGAVAVPLGIARDNETDLSEKIRAGLHADILMLSGGVSAGILDLVPRTLHEAGVVEVFHKVRLKPGQPLWFGIRPASTDRAACVVFGLPGNPVSSMVCCDLFGQAAVRNLQGQTPAAREPLCVRLSRAFEHRGDRPTFHPAVISAGRDGYSAEIVPWVGSADLCATVSANGVIAFPAGDQHHPAGSVLDAYLW